MKKTIGLGILSWKSHITLEETLKSYEQLDLTSFFDQNIIWFNQRDKTDDKIAKKYGFTPFGDKRNLAFIAEENIAQSLNTDYVLITQNDCPLCVTDKKEIKKELNNAVNLLENNTADIVRLRHRYNVGEGFVDVKKYLRYHNLKKLSKNFIIQQHPINQKDLQHSFLKIIKRLIRPFKAKRFIGRSIFIEENSVFLYPKTIKKIDNTYILSSKQINWTEQSFLIKKDFFLNVICKYINEHPNKRTLNGHQVPEIILNNKWWRNQDFKIAIPFGLFTHGRYDGSFRKNHHTFNKKLKVKK